jgi:hypothetical protein
MIFFNSFTGGGAGGWVGIGVLINGGQEGFFSSKVGKFNPLNIDF